MSKPKYHCALLHRILPLITRCETNQKVPRVESHNGYFCPTCKETYNHIGEYKVGALIGYRVHWTVRFDLHYKTFHYKRPLRFYSKSTKLEEEE